MPLTAKGETIRRAMEKCYGKKRGESVFYASKNSGRITGVDGRRTRDARSAIHDWVVGQGGSRLDPKWLAAAEQPDPRLSGRFTESPPSRGIAMRAAARQSAGSYDARRVIRDTLRRGGSAKDAIARATRDDSDMGRALKYNGWQRTGGADSIGTYEHPDHSGHAINAHHGASEAWNHFGRDPRNKIASGNGPNSLHQHLQKFHSGQHDARSTIDAFVASRRTADRQVAMRDWKARVADNIRRGNAPSEAIGKVVSDLMTMGGQGRPQAVSDVASSLGGVPEKHGWSGSGEGRFDYPSYKHPKHPGHEIGQFAANENGEASWVHHNRNGIVASGENNAALHQHLQRFHAGQHDRRGR